MGLFIGNKLVSPAEIVNTGGGAGKYQLLQRISDDNGDEIGTVGTFFTDASGTEYAVVVLDKIYRTNSTNWTSTSGEVTSLPLLNSSLLVYADKNTSTYNTEKILDWCDDNGYTSEACQHCISLSYQIDGAIYEGQLPNRAELCELLTNYVAIDTADTSAGEMANTLSGMLTKYTWSSSQYNSVSAWVISSGGNVSSNNKGGKCSVIPVLEIPNH